MNELNDGSSRAIEPIEAINKYMHVVSIFWSNPVYIWETFEKQTSVSDNKYLA